MKKMLTIAQRELAGYFFSPLAYGVGAIYLLCCGIVFFHGLDAFGIPPVFETGREPTMRPLFEMMASATVVVLPLLTMRLVSEEFSSGTIETLMTAPISDAQVIIGKFLSVLGFFAILLAASLFYVILLSIYGSPDAGVTVSGYLGLLLLGGAFISVGLFTSTLTGHQLLAAILAMVILSVFTALAWAVVAFAPQPWNVIAVRFNALSYFRDFARGVFDTRGLVFFLSVAVFFLYLSIKMLESRRWR
ncbi:MAG: ABC transporter permease subunit [Planctomycetes bacterium]|nr:ABC transporter permease subunit [Planctomycetota bacterium]